MEIHHLRRDCLAGPVAPGQGGLHQRRILRVSLQSARDRNTGNKMSIFSTVTSLLISAAATSDSGLLLMDKSMSSSTTQSTRDQNKIAVKSSIVPYPQLHDKLAEIQIPARIQNACTGGLNTTTHGYTVT